MQISLINVNFGYNMPLMMDRRALREQFRRRLAQAMEDAGLSRSELARRVRIDRSTLSLILAANSDRLPRADSAAAMAVALQVSCDWLLGVSQDRSPGAVADILAQSMEIAPSDPASADLQMQRWHREAAGYKIRYVPSTLPDLVKTDEVIDYEYRHVKQLRTEDVLARAADRLEYTRMPETDMEVCSSVQSLRALARGEGIWSDLPLDARRYQLEAMIGLVGELYPTFRWFLFDGRALYSAPITVFGPARAVIYVGQMYFVFNTTEHIRVLTQHFDSLIRAASVQPTEMAAFLKQLIADLEEDG